MGQKDLTQKQLEAFPDVFADIVNVLIFDRKEILEEDLEHYATESVFPSGDQMKKGECCNQMQDVCMIFAREGRKLALINIENQSRIDLSMPVRIMNYESVSYMKRCRQNKECLPIISLVLYFGSEREWKKPVTVREYLQQEFSGKCGPDREVMERILEKTADFKIHIVNVAYISKEVRKRFTSDFRAVADYMAGYREMGRELIVPDIELAHPGEVFQLLGACTGDRRYLELSEECIDHMEGKKMCEILDMLEERGIEKGRKEGMEEGRKEGIEKGREEGMKSAQRKAAWVMLSNGIDFDQVYTYATEISREELERIKAECEGKK